MEREEGKDRGAEVGRSYPAATGSVWSRGVARLLHPS